MLTTLFFFFAYWIQPDTDIPNFYPSFTTAREAAKKEQMETLVFFTKRSCGNCNSAWASYEKDETATKRFMSTRIDAEDFDGTVLFDLYQLDEVPCWVVLTVDGRLKEKWSGGWKDASGNPIVIHQTEPKGTESKPSIVASTKSEKPISTNTSVSDNNVSVSKSASTIPTKPTEIDKPKIESSKPTTQSTSSSTSVIEGYVLQAGYFGSETNAKKMVSDLEGKGIHYFSIVPNQQNGTTFYRVTSKSFNSESDAMKENQVLVAKGIKTTVKQEELGVRN